MISFDRSPSSIVITCTECPYWFGMRLNQIEAYLCAEGHAIRVHDVEPARAKEPRRVWEQRQNAKRHADES